MGLPKEADRTVADNKISEAFLYRHNLHVTKDLGHAPTLVWAVELLDPPSKTQERLEPPIVLTRLVDKGRDIVSIRVNRSFSEFPREQQVLSVYYMGQLSYEQGSLDSVTLDGSLHLQTIHTIADVLEYSRKGDFSQFLKDLVDENGWRYVRFPLG
ncbi:hypothetical protein A2435_00865 [Candidatus Woesebacteria bacterium RIFOXYC1_FULL_46_16]|uniref:Uncharacterized protein n=3 Tax=Candidatus Woeseibacteriota TaxID=1752722 RepID=A0A0G1QRX6_9BACT|nr:MAG: hypothetical protein UX67_C0033G0008 [Candidatus Woesebacteria bacterium GW2011_GWF2_46_8]OGM84898.1 MAG: hypothetical protein A2435_00865 [Candidatus Woesebacteria bacterium RIFOXYC1_FULL_46_16]OGM88986.1 MAG: hypothetical protein A2597_03170 [Candidatus Woesebacteria bacterium RIFOXYD1_FULL_46_19]